MGMMHNTGLESQDSRNESLGHLSFVSENDSGTMLTLERTRVTAVNQELKQVNAGQQVNWPVREPEQLKKGKCQEEPWLFCTRMKKKCEWITIVHRDLRY